MRKFLLTCGVIAAVVVVLMIGAGAVVFTWVKKNAPDTDYIEEARTEMVERYGKRSEWVPPLDGSLPADRVELFMSIREQLVLARAEISSEVDEFLLQMKGSEDTDRNFVQKIAHGYNMVKYGAGLVREGVQYIGDRTQKLLDSGMSEGEYFYIYSLMAYVWLEWEPLDSIDPDVVEKLDLESDVAAMRAEFLKIFRRQLRNQRRELRSLTEPTPDQKRALEQVEAAIDAASGTRFPYQGQLPKRWLEALEVHRHRFAESLPQTPAEMLLDAASLLDDDSPDGFRIQWDNKR